MTGSPARERFGGRGPASGFTLLEMLIVLVLMGIIASIAIPILGPGVSTTDLKRSARARAGPPPASRCSRC